MAIYSWIGAVNGSWTTASDWSPKGGPQSASTFPYNSNDDAVFATGSSAHYTVTTGGQSASLRVSGDHVTFDHFKNNDGGYGGGLLVNAGANLTVTSSSSLDYFAHDGIGGGDIDVNHAHMTDYGSLSGYGGTIGQAGVLTLYGTSASLVTLAGMDVAAGGVMTISGGASYQVYTAPVSNVLAGVLKVTGQGSSASLISADGTGKVEIYDHAKIDVYTITTGHLSFILGNYGTLEFDGSVAAGARVDFIGQHGAMTLKSDPGHPARGYAMGGVISGFAQTDSLLLHGTPVTQVLYTTGAGGLHSLELFNGTAAVGTLAIAGNYAGHRFAVTQVSATESRITEQPVTPLAHLTESLTAIVAGLNTDYPLHAGMLAGLAGTLPLALGCAAWQAVASLERPLQMAAYSVIHSISSDVLPTPLLHA